MLKEAFFSSCCGKVDPEGICPKLVVIGWGSTQVPTGRPKPHFRVASNFALFGDRSVPALEEAFIQAAVESPLLKEFDQNWAS